MTHEGCLEVCWRPIERRLPRRAIACGHTPPILNVAKEVLIFVPLAHGVPRMSRLFTSIRGTKKLHSYSCDRHPRAFFGSSGQQRFEQCPFLVAQIKSLIYLRAR